MGVRDGSFLLLRPFTTQRRLASLCRLMKRMWIGSVNYDSDQHAEHKYHRKRVFPCCRVNAALTATGTEGPLLHISTSVICH